MTESKKKRTKKKASKKKTELQARPASNEIAIPQSNDPTIAMIQVIERAAVNPDVDIDKMERLMNMQERMINRNAEIEFNESMAAVQSEVGFISADLDNSQTRSRYASYNQMNNALRPVYTKHSFALSFNSEPRTEKNMMAVICYVTHKGGHTRKYVIDMPADGKGAKGNDVMTTTHAAGAASSYGMRYLLKMIFNISVGEEDTDGNMPQAETIVYISDEQVNTLHAKITENNVNEKGFYNWMKAELKIKELEKIPVNFYDHVDKRIDSAIRAQ